MKFEEYGVPIQHVGHPNAAQMTAHLLKAAVTAYEWTNDPEMQPRQMDDAAAWMVGDLTIMVNTRTNECFISGASWNAVASPTTGGVSLSGLVIGNHDQPETMHVPIGQRELFTLILAATGMTERYHQRDLP